MKILIGINQIPMEHQDASNFLSHDLEEIRSCAEELMESGDGITQYAVLTCGHIYNDEGLVVVHAYTLSIDDNKSLSKMVADAEADSEFQFHHLTVWQGGLCVVFQFME